MKSRIENNINRLCRPCAGCVYLGALYANGAQSWACCDYALITGSRRPCPGGGACTVKKVRGKRRTGPEQAGEGEGNSRGPPGGSTPDGPRGKKQFSTPVV